MGELEAGTVATLKYWLWLTGRAGLSAAQRQELLDAFGDPERIYCAGPETYDVRPDLSHTARLALEDKLLDEAELILEQCARLEISLLTIQDAHYPDCLKNIPDPPLVLYYKGKLPDFDRELTIGMVGAREPTPYGERMAEQLGQDLARAGAVVVSGIAQGIDSQSIKGALLGGGTVVSVLAGGIDKIYPWESRFLYDDVTAAGALISEYPPGTPYRAQHFPRRNRIISGLSDGVVAVECRERSGTMITMELALEQNRDTFALPGPADAPMSAGTNRLIRMGWARLVCSAADILSEYDGLRLFRDPFADVPRTERRPKPSPKPAPDSPPPEKKEVDKTEDRAYIDSKTARELFTDDERDILLTLSERELVADEIIESTQIPARRVLSALTILSVRGFVEERPGRRFAALARLNMDI